MTFIICIAAFLRLFQLGTESLWLDEAESIRESAMTIQGITSHSNQPPLYFLLLRGWISLFGTSEFALRSLSAIFGILAVPVIFYIGKLLFNERVGLISSFLLSFAFFPIYYSQETRAYSLLLFLSLLSYLFFVIVIKKDDNRFYPAYLAASILLVYTHFYGIFIIGSQLLFYAVFFRKYTGQRWKLLSTFAFLILTLIPLYLLLKNNIQNIANDGFWISKPGFTTILNTLTGYFAAGSTKYFASTLVVILAILGTFSIIKSQNKTSLQSSKNKSKTNNTVPAWHVKLESKENISLLALWLIIPILIPFIESQIMTPIYQAKYTIGALPALCILAANGLCNIRPNWVVYPVLGLYLILISFGLKDYYQNDVKEQWKETAELINSNSEANDILVFSESYYSSPFNYYYRGNLQHFGINNLEDGKDFIKTFETDDSIKEDRIWLIAAYNKKQIIDYFVEHFGSSSVELAKQYNKITIILINPPDQTE